jgi:hypothetical protein
MATSCTGDRAQRMPPRQRPRLVGALTKLYCSCTNSPHLAECHTSPTKPSVRLFRTYLRGRFLSRTSTTRSATILPSYVLRRMVSRLNSSGYDTVSSPSRPPHPIPAPLPASIPHLFHPIPAPPSTFPYQHTPAFPAAFHPAPSPYRPPAHIDGLRALHMRTPRLRGRHCPQTRSPPTRVRAGHSVSATSPIATDMCTDDPSGA